MSEIVITANGDYVLPQPTVNGDNVLPQNPGEPLRTTPATSVAIRSNTASATTEFGYGDENDNFVAYNNGVISTDDIISHGVGAKLMVRASGISSGEVTIFYFAL